MAAGQILQADKLFYALGPIGRYQIFHLLVVSLGVFACLIQLLDNVFIGGAVEQRCARPEQNSSIHHENKLSKFLVSTPNSNLNVSYGTCNIRVKNSTGYLLEEHTCLYGFEYEGGRSQSVISQLDLVCDKEQLLRLTQTLVFAGQAVGALIGPFFSDRFGRKPAMAFANLGMLVLGMTIAFAPNYTVFSISKFLIGAMQQALYIPVCIYTGEMLPTYYRRYSIIINVMSWSVAGLTMSMVAFLLRDLSWRYLQAVLTLSSLVFIVQLCVMDESIVWLLANGKKDEAIKCIKRAARWNNKDFEEVLKAGYTDDPMEIEVEVQEDLISDDLVDAITVNKPMLLEEDTEPVKDLEENDSGTQSESDVSSEHEKISFYRVLKVRRLFINAVAMWATWFSASLCYFTLYLMVSTLAGDKYMNYILTSLMDIPACFIFYFGFNKYGRRSVTILLYSILAVGTFTLGLLRHFTDTENGTWAVVTLITSLISIVGGSGCFFSIFFYLPELFPTNVRNQATGYASCFARFGAMISPFMGTLASVAIWAPGLVMAGFASVAVFLLLLLPETKNKQLPQTIEEMESWYKKDNSSSQGEADDRLRTV